MELVTQFSLFMVNKPGVLAQVAQQLAQAKINVLAMTVMDSSEHGVLRLVTADVDRTRAALRKLNLPTTETEVLMVEMPNRPGALADICMRFAHAHINISYAYCTTGGAGGKARAVFKLADTRKGLKVLSKPEPKRREQNHRRPMLRR
ncbi:MAG: ACT domain-containing protein [Phycisphaerae bacterium]